MKNFAKVLLFIFGYVACFCVSLLAVTGTDDNASLTRQFFQGTGVEIAGCLLMLWIYFKWVRKKFPATSQFSVKIPTGNLLWGTFMSMPVLCMVYAGIAACDSDVWLSVDNSISGRDVAELAVMLPMIAIFGPLMEELSMRVFAITQFSTGRGQIIAAVVTTLLFSLMHITRWETVLFASFIYSATLIVSRNIWLSSFVHISFNLATVVIPVLTGLYTMLIAPGEYGLCGVPMPLVITFVALFFIGVVKLRTYFKSNNLCHTYISIESKALQR